MGFPLKLEWMSLNLGIWSSQRITLKDFYEAHLSIYNQGVVYKGGIL